MTKISVVNADSIFNHIKRYLLFGLVGLALIKGPGIIGNIYKTVHDSSEYNSRKYAVLCYVNKEDIESSRRLLAEFESNAVLNKADILELSVKIDVAQKTLEKKVEEEKQLNLEKKIKDEALKKEQSTSNQKYSLIPDESDEPDEPDVPLNLDSSLDQIFENIEDSFVTDQSENQLVQMLNNIYTSLPQRQDNSVKEDTISKLEKACKFYIPTRKRAYVLRLQDYDFGIAPYARNIRVMIIRKDGKVINVEKKYSWDNTPSDIPLGTIGEYVRDSNGDDIYHLININGKEYWFSNRELASGNAIRIMENLSSLAEINSKVKDIINYIRQKDSSKKAEKE